MVAPPDDATGPRSIVERVCAWADEECEQRGQLAAPVAHRCRGEKQHAPVRGQPREARVSRGGRIVHVVRFVYYHKASTLRVRINARATPAERFH
jgi:hypothetical protein